MATFNASALTYTAGVATQVFDPTLDTLNFNNAGAFFGVSANRLGFTWTNSLTAGPGSTPLAVMTFFFTGNQGPRTINLDMTAYYTAQGHSFTSVLPPTLLTTVNITVAGGTVFKVGNNSTSLNDFTSRTINGTNTDIGLDFRVVGDTLLSFGTNDTINGLGGNDTIWRKTPGVSAENVNVNGGAGVDLLLLGNGGSAGATISLRDQTATWGLTNIFMDSIEAVRGSTNNDNITGGIANFQWIDRDSLLQPIGTSGNDIRTIRGSYGFDQLDGGGTGDGSRTVVDYSNVPGGLNSINMTTGGGEDFEFNSFRNVFKNTPTSGVHNDQLINIVRVIGTDGADTLVGGTNARTVFGRFQEEFEGRGGADIIDGMGGFDLLLNGGTVAGLGVYVNLATGKSRDGTVVGTDTINGASDIGNGDIGGTRIDTLFGIEGVNGTSSFDVLIGNDNNNFFSGRGADDTISGGGDYDIASYQGSYVGIVADLVAGTVSERYTDFIGGGAFDAGLDSIDGIEEIRGTDFADQFFGGGANTALALTGVLAEGFEGRAGNDTMIGATFNQAAGFRVNYAKYERADEAVAINLSQATGPAGITGSGLTLVVDDGYGDQDTLINVNGLIGTRFDDALVGDQFRNSFRGLGGSDIIDGGGGIDTVSYSDSLEDVHVNLELGFGDDGWGFFNSAANGGLGESMDEGSDELSNIENVVGSQHGDHIRGDANPNAIWGQDGDDLLDSRDAGPDTLFGGAGDDEYLVQAGDLVVETESDGVTDAGGHDFVLAFASINAPNFVEDVRLGGTGSFNVTGNTLDNTLRGNAGSNKLIGNAGNDTLMGGLGNDTIIGGGQIDWVSYDDATAGVTVNLNLGTAQDTVGAGEDTITQTENLEGSRFGDRLTGSSAANVIKGRIGNDTISGGLGVDTLIGDGGRDTFLFDIAPPAGVDTIADFRPGTDKIALDDGAFPAFPGTGPIVSGHFRSNNTGAANDTNDFLIYNFTNGSLYYDPTGNTDGNTGRVQIATLSQVNGLFPTLTAADIVIV